MANCTFGKTCLTSRAPDSLMRKLETAGLHTQGKVTVSGLLNYRGSGRRGAGRLLAAGITIVYLQFEFCHGMYITATLKVLTKLTLV